MSTLFFTCVLCMFAATYLHLKSVEHVKLQKKYGEERGVKIGKTYGTISGTMEFVFLIGLWVSPQPRFTIPASSHLSISINGFSTPLFHLALSVPLTILGAWIAVRGVKATGLETSETHCKPKKLEASGVYSIVRHPQYLGWILSHIGISILLSAWYSLLFTPVLVALIYLISKKEEDELTKEFGKEYKEYRKKVPMFIPNF
ncbi:MAG: isoprenylcysteine carboxylmethyltransferase family protein [Candidatus Bathyarchaeota archaeon]|nr:isoprenylcysteine carboxylmethyltransferase family protein [Candidatus Bathyarchaeota archaeon]